MPDLPEHRERYIRDYVDGQMRDDADKVKIVQQVGTRRILGWMYEMFDVHCEQSRWWVITEPTNYYAQSDFPEVEQAFIFHLGLGLFMAQRSRMDMEEEQEEHVAGSWRRYQQAIDAMDSASEAADYQAIGIRCREALLALVHEHADADWIGELPDLPQKSNFKAWGNIFAERLARDELRAYAKALVDKTWGLAIWLQHYDDATPWDAEIVVDATADLLGVFGMLLHRRRRDHLADVLDAAPTASMRMFRPCTNQQMEWSTPRCVGPATGARRTRSSVSRSTPAIRTSPLPQPSGRRPIGSSPPERPAAVKDEHAIWERTGHVVFSRQRTGGWCTVPGESIRL
jgi:DNA-directed RNA polymerase specialized sigma24 family protein